jgi:hypothetical protein
MMSGFKIGDKVVATSDGNGKLTVGEQYTISRLTIDGFVHVTDKAGKSFGGFFSHRFDAAPVAAAAGTLKPQLQALLTALQTAGGPKTAGALAIAANVPVTVNVAGRIRDLRTAKYGSHKIETQRDGKATLYKLAA